MLIGYLEKLYTVPMLLECSTLVRLNILNWILAVRANATFHIGYRDYQNGGIRFGYYICTDQLPILSGQQETHSVFTIISMRRCFKKILECLQFERGKFFTYLLFQFREILLKYLHVFLRLGYCSISAKKTAKNVTKQSYIHGT